MAQQVRASSRETLFPVTGYLDRSAIRKVAARIAAGGVAVLPTDTVYGFHCAVSRLEAVETIRRFKGRRGKSGFILLASDVAMAGRLVARWPGESRKLLTDIWPAPLTAILPARKEFPPVLSSRGTIAVRVPAHANLRALIKSVGEPLVSTSVNVSGHRPLTRMADIRKAFPGLDAYLGQRGRPPESPSTIVDFTLRKPALVRAGVYPWVAV